MNKKISYNTGIVHYSALITCINNKLLYNYYTALLNAVECSYLLAWAFQTSDCELFFNNDRC